MPKNLSIYIHYPFCKSKCPYCDFNSHVKANIDHERFLAAYLRELDFFAEKLKNRKITTIFFGGGTPSLMPIFLVDKILEKISQLWQVDENCEVTLEANPTSFEAEKFKEFRNAGINRLSIGIQALNDVDLKFLGREHSASEAIKTIETASKIFDNFSFDLIYARPQQTLNSWKEELEMAISFGTKHLSLYQLTIEKGTKFFSQYKKGEFQMPDEELSAQFYEMTNQISKNHGFELYEISNYAKKSFECAHNMVYWQGGDYLGIGAGAHSRVYLDEDAKNRRAIMMVHEPVSWLNKVEEIGAGIQSDEKISSEELLEELILMGLRLKGGIDDTIFQEHFGKKLEEVFDFKKLEGLVEKGFLEISKGNIRIADGSRLLTNAVIGKVVGSL
jgi:putative oxygen-independent coproporphyrinogen III oxidase